MRSALVRRESRGCHYRSDHGQLDPTLQLNIHHRLNDDGRLADPWTEPITQVPAELVDWLSRAGAVDLGGRLLE